MLDRYAPARARPRGEVRHDLKGLHRAFLLSIHAFDGADFLQGVDAGFRGFLTFVHEMVEEKLLMLFARVEVVWGQADREHRHFGFQLHLHQTADHGLGDEVVTINATVDHQRCADNPGITAGLGQKFGVQWDFKGAANFKKVDIAFLIAQQFTLLRRACPDQQRRRVAQTVATL